MERSPPQTLARTFYHLVKHDPPTREDFLSYLEQGIPVFDDDPEALRLASGVSACATLAQVRNRARLPSLRDHRYVAELSITAQAAISFERTGRQRGHYTLWGTPDDLLACVVSVVPVDARDQAEAVDALD